MQTTAKQFSKTQLPQNWKKEESVYTGDNLVDAYLKGKQDGKDEIIKSLIGQFKTNVETAASVSEKLYATAERKKIHFRSIHLKADSTNKFSALFVAEQKDFISDKFRDILISARKLKNQTENENFYISFSFMPDSGNLNEKSLNADGFFLKYEKK